MKVAYIDQYKETFGVQPIRDVLTETDAPIENPWIAQAPQHFMPLLTPPLGS